MKKGFTMIELIFVIVILGILAAVAVPRLAATRDDARLANIKTDIGTAINAVPAWYQGQKDVRIEEGMQLDTNTWVPNATAGTLSYTWSDDGGECVTIAIFDQNGTTGTGTVAVTADYNASGDGRWLPAATYEPVLRIIKGDVSGTYNGGTVCDTLWDNLGVSEANISMAGRQVQW